MNKWKIAFFALAIIIILAIVWIVSLAVSPTENVYVPSNTEATGSVLTVQTTTEEFEAIAKKYLADAIKDSAIDVDIAIKDQIYLYSDLIIFGITVPIQMDFEPIVDNGNIILKQTNVHVGKIDIPPSTVLKLIKDSADFPSWIVVQPAKEEIYVDLSLLNIANGNRVRTKEIDLADDKILLEIVIPTK